MTDQYRATPEQWDDAEFYGSPERHPRPCSEYACILELRARVEALEGFLLELTSTVSSAALDAADAINDHASHIEALEQGAAPASEPPPLDVPQSLARDWINRHGTFAPVGGVSGNWKQRTGTEWGRVITEAARWGQRQGWDARAAAEAATIKKSLTDAPAGSLVERVMDAMDEYAGVNRYAEARAAIREVAKWVQGRHDSDQVVHTAYEAASWLRIEADRG